MSLLLPPLADKVLLPLIIIKQGILSDTAEACGEAALAAERTSEACNKRELRLVQGQHHLIQPTVTLRCRPWTKGMQP